MAKKAVQKNYKREYNKIYKRLREIFIKHNMSSYKNIFAMLDIVDLMIKNVEEAEKAIKKVDKTKIIMEKIIVMLDE